MKRLKIVLLSALLTVTVGAFAGWSGSGSFTRTHNWTDDAAAAIPITANRMDAEDDNFATGINACLAKNGENAATNNLNIGGYRLTSVGAGSASTDAATIGGTETLTNKTLTSPTLSGTPVIDLSGITSAGDLPITQGGTGASTAKDARINLGPGTRTVSNIAIVAGSASGVIGTVDLGTLPAGSVALISLSIEGTRATNGDVIYRLAKSSGTATIYFQNGIQTVYSRQYQLGATQIPRQIVVFGYVASGGTYILELYYDGNGANVSSINADTHVVLLGG